MSKILKYSLAAHAKFGFCYGKVKKNEMMNKIHI